jgi:polysaccharide export outer membrane protein
MRDLFEIVGLPQAKRVLLAALLAVCAAALSGCNAGDMAVGAGPTNAGALPEPDSNKSTSNFTQSEYRISPQDVLEITVYQFPNLSRVVQVDGTGRVSLPLVGAVVAGGRTVSEFEADVTRILGAKYLQSPHVSVFVKESVGLRVTVDGAVKKPGVYTLKGKTTLLQALAMAEGINDVGDASTVTLMRTADQKRVGAKYDVAAIRAGQAEDPMIYGGDTIVVDESAARQGLQVLKATIPLVVEGGTRVIP